MSPKGKERIEKIYSGRIDFYIPFTIQTEKSYSEICRSVADCVSKEISDHLEGIKASMIDSISGVLDGMHIKPVGIDEKQNLISRCFGKQKTTAKKQSQVIGAISIGVQPSENGIKINVIPEETEIYTKRHNELLHDYEVCGETYGADFVALQSRYVLLPINLKLNSGESVWLNAILVVFGNLMGMLKLELPIVNVSVQPLFDRQYDKYINSIENQWGMELANQDDNIEGICNAYLQKIENCCNVKISVHKEGRMHNVIMTRFDGMPKQIDNIPDEVQEDLYRIIAAPVSKYECTSYKKIAREYLTRQSWTSHNFKYITSTTGGCLSIIDEAICDWARACFVKDNSIDEFRPEHQETVDHMLARSICNNVEFALIIPILKHLNTSYIFNLKQINSVAVSNVQMVYNSNLIMISSLQERCYGTASEQAIAFEKMMPYYLKEEIKSEKMDALDRIIADAESRKNNSFQMFISIAGFIIALLFGLPSIYETFSIIRDLCFFIDYDVRFLTVKNASFGVWILLMLILSVFCWKKYKTKKNRHSD